MVKTIRGFKRLRNHTLPYPSLRSRKPIEDEDVEAEIRKIILTLATGIIINSLVHDFLFLDQVKVELSKLFREVEIQQGTEELWLGIRLDK